MASYSMKKGGKEVGPASTYAEPHTMQGKKLTISSNPGSPYINKLEKPIKTSGIKMRGAGAATKGVMCRGPMA